MEVPENLLDTAYSVCLESAIQPQWLLSLAWHYGQCDTTAIKHDSALGVWCTNFPKEDLATLHSTLGTFKRSAEFIITSNPHVMANSTLWLDLLNEYLFSPQKQFDLEKKVLQQIYHPKLKGLEELLNKYIGIRAGYNNVRSILPGVHHLVTVVNPVMKEQMSKRYQRV